LGAAFGAACTGNIVDPNANGDINTGGAPPGSGSAGADPGAVGGPGSPGSPGAPGSPGGGIGQPGSSGGSLPAAASCPKDPLGVANASVRLTDRQFRNTVAALFPFAVDAGTRYPVSLVNEEFTTSFSANPVFSDDIPSFADTAESIALQAVTHMAQMLPCNPAGNEAACARQFIDAFAARAYRRPLEPGERDPLVALYDGVRAGSDPLDFNLGIAAVIAAVLQAPQFLYKLEIGTTTPVAGVRKLSGYEAASKLSYLYWDAPPDDMLLEKARTGALLDATTVAGEAGRLLKDPRARNAAWRFFSEWLGFGDRLFDGRVDAALAGDFAEETKRFVLGVALDSPAGAVKDLLDNDKTQMNRRLAKHYGLPYDGTGDTDWRPVTLPPALKGGVLAKAQVATAHSSVGETSVVLRGKFVHDRLLCVDLGAPPPNAQAMNPMLPANATPRDRVDARLKMSACAGCHTLMDNVGLGMEDVDALGRARTKYTSGAPVDAHGRVVALLSDGDFVGTAGLAGKLAGHAAFSDCLTRQWYRYATGHRETDAEAKCHLPTMSKRFADSGYNLRELMLSVAGSDAFLYRTEGTR
jgi:uncharacterized protein DUF1592/uncharacterized protein DUF1588/uncharacterized protein DUF1595/uncharacterized protein DUF1585